MAEGKTAEAKALFASIADCRDAYFRQWEGDLVAAKAMEDEATPKPPLPIRLCMTKAISVR